MSELHEGNRKRADGDLGDEERRTLALVPMWALAVAGGNQERIGAGDARALARVVQESVLYRRDFVRGVLAPLTEHPERVVEEHAVDSRDAEAGLRAAAGILQRVPHEDADAFRKVIMVGVWRVVAAAGWPEEGLAALASDLGVDR